MSNDQFVFCFPGESFISRFIGIIGFSVIFLLGILSILAWNVAGISTGVVLIFLVIVLLYAKVIIRVSFYDDYLVARYVFDEREVPISSITKCYKNHEGFIPTHVYVIKYKNSSKEKKITFYCDAKDFDSTVGPWLSGKGVRFVKRK